MVLDHTARLFSVELWRDSSSGPTDPWDVSQWVTRGFQLKREMVSFEGATISSTEIEISGDDLEESLDPTLNFGRFGAGNLVKIKLANSSGTLQEPPFGGWLRIRDFDASSGGNGLGQPRTVRKIKLFLVCELGYARQLSPPAPPNGILGLGSPRTGQSSITNQLDTVGLELTTVPGDPELSFVLLTDYRREGYSTVVDEAHKVCIWNSQEADTIYGLWADSLGQVRIYRVKFNPGVDDLLLNCTPEELAHYDYFDDEKQSLPEVLRITAEGSSVVANPPPVPTLTVLPENDGQGLARITSISADGEGNTNKTVRARFELVFPPREQLRAGGAVSTGGLIDAEAETVRTSWDGQGRISQQVTKKSLPLGKIDTLLSGQPDGAVPTPAEETVKTWTYYPNSKIASITEITKRAAGLLQLENPEEETVSGGQATNPSATQLVVAASKIEEWLGEGTKKAKYVTTSDVFGNSKTEPFFGGSEAEPPATQYRGTGFTEKSGQSQYDFRPTYPMGRRGRGVRTIERAKAIAPGALSNVGKCYCRLLFGTWLAKEILFPLSQAVHDNWTPGAAIAVLRTGTSTSDLFIGSGDVIFVEPKQIYCGTTGIWVGTMESGTVTSGIDFQGTPLTFDGDPATANGQPIYLSGVE